MAGWSKVTDAYALDCFKIFEELHRNGFSVKCGEIDNKLRKLFNQLVSGFWKELCPSSYLRPLPPMLGDGKPVDLLKLYLSVREKGGYESVCRKGLWDLVSKESGFSSGYSTSLKLVYVKYLELLDEWFCKVVKDQNSGKGVPSLMDLKLDIEGFFSDVRMKDGEGFVDLGIGSGLDLKDVQSRVGSVEGKDFGDSVKRSKESEQDGAALESTGVTEEVSELSRKRKRECYLPLLDWLKRVAKNPCDPAVGSLPERSKWKAYGSEHVWKQILLAREAMLLKVNVDSKTEQSIWQKKQKMHPTMYDDHTEKSTSRCSQRLISAKETQSVHSSRKSQPRDCCESSSTGTVSDVEDEESFYGSNHRRKRIPLGPFFQAEVPTWTGVTLESENRWLGTPVWPLEKGETRGLLEMDRIGKGRQDSCGCQSPGSVECVRFHISEKRNKVKLELGSAFSKWKFDDMGEEVSQKWTQHEEKKFADIIKSSPSSLGKNFWVELSSHFKNKSREVLASYYFNVYLLRRRADQNRSDPSNIDSDDDELEKVGHGENKPTGSILCSPKKVHLNFR